MLSYFALLSFWNLIYYAIGSPGHEFNEKSIFSGYTSFLCRIALKRWNIEYTNDIKNLENKNIMPLMYEIRRWNHRTAQNYLTWHNILGMCSVCTFFWIALIAWLFIDVTIAIPLIFAFINLLISKKIL